MKNLNEWFSITELLEKNLADFPKTDKGISKKAEREGWKKRQRSGVKGKTFEYYVGDMPQSVQKTLGFDASSQNITQEPPVKEQVEKKLKTIDKIMAAVSLLEQKVKELEEPKLDSSK